ncbi:glycosyl hydrolase family 28 protein [Paenibacillus camerounensis]|uniref:glycosyl hydrolase family 28 protein n=1 Tax=Paenibacillus camerounensis TaxID=1243663 RepID=UPI00069385CA|nr:glycosyl hydrolase family 28 protein [Paenibacillus camerounensis]
MYSRTYTFSEQLSEKMIHIPADYMFQDKTGGGFIPNTGSTAIGKDKFKDSAGWFPSCTTEQASESAEIFQTHFGAEVQKEGWPLRFKAVVPEPGIYAVKIHIAGGEDGIARLNLYSNRRNLIKRDIQIAPGDFFSYQYKVHIGDYISLVGQSPQSDLSIYVTAIGTLARISAISIEKSDAPTLFLGGDSIVADYAAQYPYNPITSGGSWGQHLLQYFHRAAIDNQAHGGMTTNCFREDGHWEIISERIRPGDVFMFQFGHNDQKRRALAAFTGYSANLRWYVQQVRSRGAIPVIVTSLSRIPGQDDQGWYDLLEDHAEACRRIGRECNVPVIDLHEYSFQLFCQMGRSNLKGYFKDEAHTNDYGAIMMAEFIATEIKQQKIEPLCRYMNGSSPMPWIPDESLRPLEQVSPLEQPELPILPTDLPELPYADCKGIKGLEGLKKAMINGLLDPTLKYFHPYAEMPRGQFAFVFLKAAPYPKRPFQGKYCDLYKYEFDAPNIQALIDGRLIDERTTLDGRFRPDDALTGGELLSFIIRHLFRKESLNYSLKDCERKAQSLNLIWDGYGFSKKVNRIDCLNALVQMLELAKLEGRTTLMLKSNFYNTTFEMEEIMEPKFPGQYFRAEDYRHSDKLQSNDLQAIQRAVDDCSAQGGGTVIVSRGEWGSGPIHLRSHVHLSVEKGAVINFSDSFADYLPVVFTRWEGMECYNYSPLIYAVDCENIAVTGEGTLNGNGEAWWHWKQLQQTAADKLCYAERDEISVQERVFGTEEAALRPSFIQPVRCRNVLIEGLVIHNGPQWTVHPVYCENIIIRRIDIVSCGPNTDGLNPDSCRNVLIEDCSFETGDDCIAINSGMNEDGWRVNKPCENIVIRNCVMKEGHGGLVIGSGMSGGVRNVYAHNCTITGGDRGIRLKSMRGRGGYVENIRFENIQIDNVREEAVQINMYYGYSTVVPKTSTPSDFSNIHIKNISGEGAGIAVEIKGLPEHRLKNISLENINLSAEKALVCSDVENIILNEFNVVTVEKDFEFINVDRLEMKGFNIR